MSILENKIREYRHLFEEHSSKIKEKREVEELRQLFFGRKKGLLTLLFEELKTLPPEEKKAAGRALNEFKEEIQQQLVQLELKAKTVRPQEKIAEDLTLPGWKPYWGAPHPLTLFQLAIEKIFVSMGFTVEDGPEIETDYYNFEALNFPPHHPARDSWDTLYINDKLLLRTHTSPVQIRVMEKKKPPIRIIIPGKVFRRETADPTHLPMFYQVEGLVVDRGITFAHLKGTLEYFIKALFGEKIKLRFRPSFFPFTEPSAEVDIECIVCHGQDPACRVCGGSGWKEILGAGMVDPQVFKNVNIDPEKYSGWAFGLGIDRTAMFAYQIPEIRYFYENDLRFLRQFNRK
ncbi:MAG TPA: phenylalanine--tRNA ligase subunit alpha [Candidatus Aminicenantes bacterium]|nr:MAG: phenylalanine--tRNA ligase subunit alpha [Candidatus Aminicenantes bacterium]HEK84783.1 phenylalanine--tRNA ligase subunit alpha [Candidatus Aminicenantes bacterium]